MSYKLDDIDVGILIIQECLKDLPLTDPRSLVDLLIDQFEVKFRKSLTINSAKDMVSRALSHLSLDQLRTFWEIRFDSPSFAPRFFSRTEFIMELRRNL